MADKQTSVYSSYLIYNVFEYQFLDRNKRIQFEDTPEVREDLKAFVKNALWQFCVYNTILWLTCELLGHHLENLQDFLRELPEDPHMELRGYKNKIHITVQPKNRLQLGFLVTLIDG